MGNSFAGKNIVVGVTGSIAAFKVAGWVSTLVREEAEVKVVMTESATRFVSPLTFSALTGKRTVGDMFDDGDDPMLHISLASEADVLLIAPATANTIARLATGMADNLLTSTALVTRKKILVCPAMNSRMFDHPVTVENLRKLEKIGYEIIEPGYGRMACREEGQGRLADWRIVEEYLVRSLTTQDLEGKKILVTAGPTREPIDPARFLSNRSSGKMGYAIARAAFRRGARVTLVSGPTSLECPAGVNRLDVETAKEMYSTVLQHAEEADIVIKSAAVADYRPAERATHKVKKEEISLTLSLERNPDILFELGKRKKKGQLLIGFAAESQRFREEGERKLKKKNLDLIAVNDISGENTGFESESNQLLLISDNGVEQLPFTGKLHTADLLLDRIHAL
jgi:phosphopantothenoylcysteine decarboxylase/phosphopantothenate--cysteine ligase